MPTLRQSVERARDAGSLPADGGDSVRQLLRRFTPGSGSVRALLPKMSQPQRLPWAVILCRFKGEQSDPATDRFYREMFTPGTGGMVEYWRDASLGAIDIAGSRVFEVELDLERKNAGVGAGHGRSKSVDAAIAAVQRDGGDPVTGFHSQIAVLHHNWSRDDVPPGLDWQDPQWGKYWIDGSADGRGKVCLTPPHNGNITAHEMGHGFGMNHDVGADFTTHYADPCCIMSQNQPFTHPTWNRAFGPALCLPHLEQQGWMYKRRLYYDAGDWMTHADGITLPLAPISRPGARANLGIKLAYAKGNDRWDYYIEYVIPADWNRGVPGAPYVFIRRIAQADVGPTPAYLGFIQIERTTELVEPSGNVRFRAELTSLPGPILRVSAAKL